MWDSICSHTELLKNILIQNGTVKSITDVDLKFRRISLSLYHKKSRGTVDVHVLNIAKYSN